MVELVEVRDLEKPLRLTTDGRAVGMTCYGDPRR
jgi:hypothetical protein